ncbi:DUF6088 family protein [Mycoplasmopsis glycophila]|uniref:Transcriptional regulator, AbiEi antitoxin, Type IV TA system n=1 Tax=Mycoplasmopsis glycophila TaxID=171285 RepID=A0A449AWB0_9BACT|nr:DUF6088 family protein [Mycoplasmopsis glycophila]VEU70943.1 Uncharacterised protein [Mycoplasmopsis glycophila]
MKNITAQIENIMNENEGKIFAIKDFYDLGSPNTIKSILRRLVEKNKIIRLINGLYTKPYYSERFQEYGYPTSYEVAIKLAEKSSWKIAPTSVMALNDTGLSTQVPVVLLFASTGPSKTYIYNNIKIIFKHTSNNLLDFESDQLRLLIQAIKFAIKERFTKKEMNALIYFSQKAKIDFTKEDLTKLPFPIFKIIKEIENQIKYE